MSFCVLVFLMISLEVAQGQLTDRLVLITNQSFDVAFECPPEVHCVFRCAAHLASCLESVFRCGGNSSCDVECLSENACCYARFECTPPAVCNLNCVGLGSCRFFKEETISGALNATGGSGLGNDPGSFSTTFGPILTKGFAMGGIPLSNYLLTPDYTIQMLSLYIPSDNDTLTTFLTDLKIRFTQLILETGLSSWQRFPPYNLTKVNDYIIAMAGDPDQAMMWTFQNFIDSYDIPGLVLTSAHLNKTDFSVELLLSTQFVLSPFFPFLGTAMKPYFVRILRYPNDSFVNVHLTQVNPNLVRADVSLYPAHCNLPVPFWGTYCLDTVWYSEGNIVVSSDDLVASDTTHAGTLNVESTSLSVIAGILQTQNLMISSGTLNVGTATLSVSDHITLVDSTMVIQSNAINISANTLTIGENMKLVVNLQEDDLSQLQDSGYLAIKTVYSPSINGTFSTISFVSAKGNVKGCTHSFVQNYSLFVVIRGCEEDSPINRTLVASVTGGVFGLACIFGAVAVALRCKKDKVALKNLTTAAKNAQESET